LAQGGRAEAGFFPGEIPMESVLILIGAAALLPVIAVFLYNMLIGRRNQADNAASSIDVYLKQRFDLIPNLVAAVKSYMKHERETLTQLTELRAKAMQGPMSDTDRVTMDAQVSRMLGSIRVAAENYPQLKANENFIQLQGTMNEVEEKIAAARRGYNASVTDYNNALQMFPSNLIASIMRFKGRPLFETTEAERQNPDVQKLFAN
jgi:LemA protein